MREMWLGILGTENLVLYLPCSREMVGVPMVRPRRTPARSGRMHGGGRRWGHTGLWDFLSGSNLLLTLKPAKRRHSSGPLPFLSEAVLVFAQWTLNPFSGCAENLLYISYFFLPSSQISQITSLAFSTPPPDSASREVSSVPNVSNFFPWWTHWACTPNKRPVVRKCWWMFLQTVEDAPTTDTSHILPLLQVDKKLEHQSSLSGGFVFSLSILQNPSCSALVCFPPLTILPIPLHSIVLWSFKPILWRP